jgi:hypothetical protein
VPKISKKNYGGKKYKQRNYQTASSNIALKNEEYEQPISRKNSYQKNERSSAKSKNSGNFLFYLLLIYRLDRPYKIDTKNIPPINTQMISPKNDIQDEYQGLSYLNGKNSFKSPCRSEDTNITEDNLTTSPNAISLQKKKSGESDFRVKYKTEKCKFWELNKVCKYGDNVINEITF